MNNVWIAGRITLVAVMFLGGPLSWAGEPLTHEDIPTLSDHEVEELCAAERIADVEEPHEEKPGLFFMELAVTQLKVLPAYRERYKEALFSLADLVVEEQPSELWSTISFADEISEELVAKAYIIAMYEMFYGNSKWMPSGDLQIHNDADGVNLRYKADINGDTIEIRPTPVLQNLNKILGNPWSRRDFGYPLLAGIDTEKVVVRQAYWDDDYETLLFALEPVGDEPVLTTIIIENLYTNLMAILTQDGEFRAAIDEHAQVAGENTRNLDPGQVEIQVRLEGLTRFTLAPME